MAKKDYSLPHLDMINLVPQELRNPMLKSIIDNLFNRFMTKDEAIPLYGYVGRKPSSPDDRTPKIPQPNVERDINALIPVLSFKVGTETFSFTVQDLIRKAEVLGVSKDQASWLFSQGNNYAPPIDFDRFTNFFNYCWVAKALPNTPSMEWNPTLAPEYYVIAKPKDDDLDKLNVVTSTTGQIVLTGTGFHPQTWVVKFIDANSQYWAPGDVEGFTFTVTGTGAGLQTAEVTQKFTLPPTTIGTSDVFVVNYVAAGASQPLLSFRVVRDPIYDDQGQLVGTESFGAGDTFTISAPFLASSYSVTPNNLSSGIKGKFTAVNSLDTYQTINGVVIKENDRVLVKDQGNSAENGIYIVKPDAFVRASDYSGSTIVAGAKVFDKTHEQTFVSTSSNTWVLDPATVSNTNDWQEYNFWMHRDEVAAGGYDTTKIVQATRPIIEFHANVKLNTWYYSDSPVTPFFLPSSSTIASALPTVTPTDELSSMEYHQQKAEYQQVKTEFNQVPLFDVYRYDGTHSGKASPLFFYVEDPTADIDPALQRRVKHSTNDSADFVFAHGLLDGETSLFYKTTDGSLHSIWEPGYASAQIVDAVLAGAGNGTFTISVEDPFTAQQIWTLTAISPTQFEISGSKTKVIPAPYDIVTVGMPYSNGIFNISITAGSTAFETGDTYTFRVGNFETTRYVYRDSSEEIFDLFGGQAADNDGVGAWQVPRMFYNNVAAANGGELPEGTLYSHFRGILQNQIEGAGENRAFGGSIKLWSEQQNLLASLLMQRDMTPISMIDFAQRQYENALAQVTDIFITELVQYFASNGVVTDSSELVALVDYVLSMRAKDNDVKTVLYDTTSGVVGFPATLPMLGVTPLSVPGIFFDHELGLELMVHHDGHKSPVYSFTQEFRDRMLSPGMLVKRSDGAYTPAVGSFTTTAPANPYKGELWFYPTNGTQILRAFDVLADGSIAPNATAVGQFWYNRNTQTLYKWDGAFWIVEPNMLNAWVDIDPSAMLNAAIVEIETRLYTGTNEQQRTYFSELDVKNALQGPLASQLERELATWAAANEYDPYAPDYVSTDAFTWNYGSLSVSKNITDQSDVGQTDIVLPAIAALGDVKAYIKSYSSIEFVEVPFTVTGNTVTVMGALLQDVVKIDVENIPPRWYNVLQAHQASVGALPTARPNLEPWKLVGYSTKPISWDATYAAPVTPELAATYTNTTTARVVLHDDAGLTTPLTGLQTIDGRVLQTGDIVLLVSESSSANNGLWVVSPGAWNRATTTLVTDLVVNVVDGTGFSGTQWVLTMTPAVLNASPVVFEQARYWKRSMWFDIQAANPALKLSVDINRADLLLPPYVSPNSPAAPYALTNVMPSSPSAPYQFGEGSPVETVWMKTVEYRYSLARALFRAEPLTFLGHCWGFAWVDVDGILYDGFDVTVPGHPRFRLHGDQINAITRRSPFTFDFGGIITGPVGVDLYITYNGYTQNREQSFMVKTSTGTVVGYLREGVTESITGAGYSLQMVRIEDEGTPFRMGDRFHVTANSDGSGLNVVFEPISYNQFYGFGQTFTQALRAASIDTTQGYAMQAYRGWNVNLGYRAGGLVSTDDLRVFTDAESLPESSYALRFTRSQYAKDLWVQGLRVTVVQIGSSKPAKVAGFVPTNDASDWVFRVEGYNSRYLGIDYYLLDTSGEYMTFNALSGAHTSLEFKHYTDVQDTVHAELPLTCVGLQNLITLLYGYSMKLEADGWRFQDEDGGNVDAETGRVLNWQLEIEKFIDRVYAGINVGEGHVMVPFMDRIWLSQDEGLLSQYFDSALFDVTGHPGVFDTLGAKINTDDLTILRSRGKSMISANVPMFSVHAQVDEYEHLFVFNNLTSPSTGEGLIYDPFSGARIVTVKMNGRRQAAQTMRPEFGGHYLVGDEVKRNLQSSVDKVALYYDTDHVFEDELSTRHALALLGYSPKEYMANLDLNDHSQFNFWRGLIQMKGTNASINAFLNNDRFQDAKLDEYWAYKVAEYGDSRSKVFPELKLTVDDTLQQFTKLIFDNANPPADFASFSQINSNDEDRWFSLEDLDSLAKNGASFEAHVVGTYERTFTSGDTFPQQIKLDFVCDDMDFDGPVNRLNMTTLEVTGPGTVEVIGYGPATPKFNPVKLFNYVDSELVEEIPVWHPAAGAHTPNALAAINVISGTDPARYNASTQVTGNANYDPLRAWGAKEIGRVWWDTTNLGYVPYFDSIIYPTVDERLSRWGTLADFATVDVVEWVESAVPPSEYDAQAVLDAGDADLDASTKADGQAYGAKTYYRDRLWAARPIAWSKAGVPTEAAHPSFNASYNSTLTFRTDGLITLESGTFADLGIVENMRVGAWQSEPVMRPLSEYVLQSFTKLMDGVPLVHTAYNGFDGSIELSIEKHTDRVGQILFAEAPVTEAPSQFDENGNASAWDVSSFLRVIETASGEEEVILVRSDSGTDTGSAAVPATSGSAAVKFGSVESDTETGYYSGKSATSGYASVDFARQVSEETETGFFAGADAVEAVKATQLVAFGTLKTKDDNTGLASTVAATSGKATISFSQPKASTDPTGLLEQVSANAMASGRTYVIKTVGTTNYTVFGLGGTTVRAATTGNISLTGTQTVDGVALAAGDRVLVKNQTTLSENGVYLASASAWTRAVDMDTSAEFANAEVFVTSGTTNVGTGWKQTATVNIVNADAVTFTQMNLVGMQFTATGPATGSGSVIPVYDAVVTVDGVAKTIKINGDTAQTFADLVYQINADLDALAIASLNGTKITITSASSGSGSSVVVSSSNHSLFTSLDDYANVSNINGTNSVPATYTATVVLGGTTFPLVILGDTAKTFGDLVSRINFALPGAPCSLNEAGILFTDSTSVSITDGTLFTALADFNAIQPATNGVAAVAAMPAATYVANVSIDGVNYAINVPGTTKTLGDFASLLNAQIFGQPFSISGSKLVASSSTSGSGSVVTLGGTAFTALKHFDGFDSVNGADAVPPTTYYANVIMDGVPYSIAVSGTVQTVGKLIEELNLALPGQPFEITDKFTVTATSPSVGASSMIELDGTAFTSLTTFDGFGSRVDGTDAVAAVPPLPYHGAQFETFIGQTFIWSIPSFGMALKLTSSVAGTFSTESMLKFIAQNLSGNISLFDAAKVEIVVPLSDPDGLVIDPSKLCNDDSDPQFAVNNGVGWRAWSVPTQAALDADSRVPNSSWYPYLGEFTSINPSIEVIQDAASNGVLVLNNGSSIERYQTSWSEWTELKGAIIRTTASNTGALDIAVPSVTIDRISVYVNGVAQLSGTYSLVGTTLTLSMVTVGSEVTVVIRAYSPSTEELKFDPSVADNLLIQRHYKIDYQYVEIPVRGEDGTIVTTKYYFWVKNRSVAARKKSLSVKAIAALLTSGPSQYLTFQNIQGL